jgi:hypothetical protein
MPEIKMEIIGYWIKSGLHCDQKHSRIENIYDRISDLIKKSLISQG